MYPTEKVDPDPLVRNLCGLISNERVGVYFSVGYKDMREVPTYSRDPASYVKYIGGESTPRGVGKGRR